MRLFYKAQSTISCSAASSELKPAGNGNHGCPSTYAQQRKSNSLKPALATSMVVLVSKLLADVNTFTAPVLMGTVLLHKYITEKMNSESVKNLTVFTR